jgi:DNA repair photolyase
MPFQVLTKSGSCALQDIGLYGPNDAFASTLTFIKPEDSKKWEPNAALPEDRMATLRKFHEAGIHTWVSLEPVIDPDQTLELIRATHEYVDLYKVGKLNYVKSEIDWRMFGARAIKILESLNKSYYIKSDLAKHLDGIPFTNTDNRSVQPPREGSL